MQIKQPGPVARDKQPCKSHQDKIPPSHTLDHWSWVIVQMPCSCYNTEKYLMMKWWWYIYRYNSNTYYKLYKAINVHKLSLKKKRTDHSHPHELWWPHGPHISTLAPTITRLWAQTWPSGAFLARISPWPQVALQATHISLFLTTFTPADPSHFIVNKKFHHSF